MTQVKTDLLKESKRLIEFLIAFNGYMIDQCDPIYYDWSNITQDQYDNYKLAIQNYDVTISPFPNVSSTNNTYTNKTTSDTFTKLTMAEKFKLHC